ncbi:hypothetical protein [Streptomyces sp. NPDC048516]|uniref:hypothetical protein n=1 Tax=Streptomyces sp. NPDC048516 TaxID=3365565 RepID=UPI00371108F6
MVTARTAHRALCLAVLLLTTACGGDSEEDKNAPLPRKSEAQALGEARQYTKTLAGSSGVELASRTAVKSFHECVGKGDETAQDGRFTLTYHVRGELPREQHIAAARRLRKALEGGRITVGHLDERPGDDRPVILDGSVIGRRKERISLTVESVEQPDSLQYVVTTPCYLPPGVRQQEF